MNLFQADKKLNKIYKMKKILIFLLWIIFWGFCNGLSGEIWFNPNDEAGYFISNYEVNINITKTWILNIVEIIKANLTRYRIWPVRIIPAKYILPEGIWFFDNFEKEIFSIKLDQIRVAWFRYLPLFINGVWNIRIWEDEDYSRWKKQYIINYNLHNAINKTSKQNEFFWEIIPNNRDTRINSVNFKIKLPKEIKLDKNNTYIFIQKDNNFERLENIEFWSDFISGSLNQQLKPWESIGIWIVFPKDYFDSDLKWNLIFFLKQHIFETISVILIIFAIFTGIVVFTNKDIETEK